MIQLLPGCRDVRGLRRPQFAAFQDEQDRADGTEMRLESVQNDVGDLLEPCLAFQPGEEPIGIAQRA